VSADYPVALRVAGRRCVVVGGGTVAARKVRALVDAGAEIVLVAPDVAPEIDALVRSGKLRVERRRFAASDLDGAFLAFAATDLREVNRAVAEAASQRGALVNVADDPSASDFANPSIIRRQDVTVAVSTGGRSPAFARFLREQLQEWLSDSRCTMLALAAEIRRELLGTGASPTADQWRRALNDPHVLDAIEAGDDEAARQRVREALESGR
jgi:precorrin-2 dehydrogenase / sirohydrochlorin ferrochelatase